MLSAIDNLKRAQQTLDEALKGRGDDILLDAHDDICNALDILEPGWADK